MKRLIALLLVVVSLATVGVVAASSPKLAPATDTVAATQSVGESHAATSLASEQEKEVTVYVTKTGKKYHRDGCRYLSKSKIATTLSKAKQSYGACSVCKPPQ